MPKIRPACGECGSMISRAYVYYLCRERLHYVCNVCADDQVRSNCETEVQNGRATSLRIFQQCGKCAENSLLFLPFLDFNPVNNITHTMGIVQSNDYLDGTVMRHFHQLPFSGLNSCSIMEVPQEIIIKVFSYLDFYTLCKCRRVCFAWDELAQSKSSREQFLLDVWILRHIFQVRDWGEEDELSALAQLVRGKFPLRDVTRLILRLGKPGGYQSRVPGGGRIVVDAEFYFKELFNEKECPNLRTVTVEDMNFSVADLGYLSITCRHITLYRVLLQLRMTDSGRWWYAPSRMNASIDYDGVRDVRTGLVVVAMEKFWDPLERSLVPQTSGEISLTLRNLGNIQVGAGASFLRGLIRTREIESANLRLAWEGTDWETSITEDVYRSLRVITQYAFLSEARLFE